MSGSGLQVMMSSRRTIMDGEVVTFATGFKEGRTMFGVGYDATGPFEVSASRESVVVHRATTATPDEAAALIHAIRLAEAARDALKPTWRGGCDSKYPSEPTGCDPLTNPTPPHSGI